MHLHGRFETKIAENQYWPMADALDFFKTFFQYDNVIYEV